MSGVTRPLVAALGTVVLVGLVVAGGLAMGVEPPGDGVAAEPLAFENATASTGLEYVHDSGADVGHGDAGVFVADVTRNGYPDVLTTGGDRPELWRNDRGEFTRHDDFPDLDGEIKSATFVDYDDDGWRDVVLFPTYSEPVALHNDEGTFEHDDVGLGNTTYALGAAAGDVDGDGRTDLFVYQSGDWGEDKPAGYISLNLHVADDNGNPNVLYENVGGEFERVEDAGFEGNRWSLAGSVADLNGDGDLDVHVANDFNNDVVYLNRGDGTFEQHLLGNVTARNGMSSEIGDVDGDGRPDVFTTNIELPISRESMGPERYDRLEWLLQFEIQSNRTDGNTLSINRGNGTFEESAEEYGVQTGGWGWAASYQDLNNDGRQDLIHATENRVRIDPDDPVYTYPMVWERTRDGFDRRNASATGLEQDDGRGLVTLDYDRDGDLDVVSAVYNAPFGVYENVGVDDANALQVLAVEDDGTPAYGATVEVEAGRIDTTRFQHSRTDFMSQEPREVHVGLRDNEEATVRVTWPDGTERTFEDVPAGQYARLTRDGGVETVVEFEE